MSEMNCNRKPWRMNEWNNRGENQWKSHKFRNIFLPRRISFSFAPKWSLKMNTKQPDQPFYINPTCMLYLHRPRSRRKLRCWRPPPPPTTVLVGAAAGVDNNKSSMATNKRRDADAAANGVIVVVDCGWLKLHETGWGFIFFYLSTWPFIHKLGYRACIY